MKFNTTRTYIQIIPISFLDFFFLSNHSNFEVLVHGVYFLIDEGEALSSMKKIVKDSLQ